MKRFTFALVLLFLALGAFCVARAQSAAEVVATALDSCRSGTAVQYVIPVGRVNRVYMVDVCNGYIRVTAYDTNLVRLWSVTDTAARMMTIGEARADSRGNVYVGLYHEPNRVGVLKIDPDGDVVWRYEHGLPPRHRGDWPSLAIGERGNVFIAYRTGFDIDSVLQIEEISPAGDSIRVLQYPLPNPGQSWFNDVAIFSRPNGELRLVTTERRGALGAMQDVLLDTLDRFTVLGEFLFPEGEFRLQNATIDRSGTATITLFDYDVYSTRLQAIRSSENGTLLRMGVIDLSPAERGKFYMLGDRRGNLHVLLPADSSTGPSLRRLAADGTEIWRRTAGNGEPTADSLTEVIEWRALAVDKETESYVAGLRDEDFVVQRIDTLGMRRWSLTLPRFVPRNANTPVVRIVVDESGAVYLLTSEYRATPRQSLMRIVRIRQAGTASIAGESTSTGARGKIFAAEPSIAPNPATDAVSLRFSLLRPENVTIELFDLAGEKLATIANVRGEAGENHHEFSLRSAEIPSGAYLVKITAGEEVRIAAIRVVR